MTSANEIQNVLDSWAPQLAARFHSFGYFGSDAAVKWITDSELKSELELLLRPDGYDTAADMWRKVLRERTFLPAPAILLILEHARQQPAHVARSLAASRLTISKTVSNVAFRAADALYEGGKDSFAGEEIDVAIARLEAALSEFRFAIESDQLSDTTRRIATGKYATAVAMLGRWSDVPAEAASRALVYSQQSMNLGNERREMLLYRLELLVLRFDQTGDVTLLRDALELLSTNQHISEGSELAEAEARLRLGLVATEGSRDARRYLEGAAEKLSTFHARSGVEEARRSVLAALIAAVREGRLRSPATSFAIPRGLIVSMTTAPSVELWEVVRAVVDGLEDLRSRRGWIPAAVLSARLLRQIVDGPQELLRTADLSLYVEITEWLAAKASWNRHIRWEAGAAALSAAKRSGDHVLALRSQEIFAELAGTYATWPLPQIGLARVRDYLDGANKPGTVSTNENWREAAILALKSTGYARSNLGGRNEVFAVADARGFLSETFVFKQTTQAKAEHEASMLRTLRAEISRRGRSNLFEVPRPLAIVEVPSADGRQWVHVSQRAAGRLVSELPPENALSAVGPILDLLAVFHSVAGRAPAGKSAWRPLKDHLKMWARTLFGPTQADRFVDLLRSTFPEQLPLVRKRDGHASNWLLDPAGRVVAIDLESSEFLPIGCDVAQLIEDNALVPATTQGWQTRLALMRRYLDELGEQLDDPDLARAYGWFAVTRALRLGTEREAGKQLRRHARELCAMLVESQEPTVAPLARELLQALSRSEHSDRTEDSPTHDHRRLSKSMAYMLRHHGPTHGVQIDTAGFASIDELAVALNADSTHLLAVAEHPGEPRFEIRDGRIRALYGHSLDVVIDAGIKVGAPSSLYHGSSWSVLDLVMRDGLVPMQRRVVHLTNSAEEAMSVGTRKGAPLVFSVAQTGDEEPVAEGIWVSPAIPAERLSIVNPFVHEAGAAR